MQGSAGSILYWYQFSIAHLLSSYCWITHFDKFNRLKQHPLTISQSSMGQKFEQGSTEFSAQGISRLKLNCQLGLQSIQSSNELHVDRFQFLEVAGLKSLSSCWLLARVALSSYRQPSGSNNVVLSQHAGLLFKSSRWFSLSSATWSLI